MTTSDLTKSANAMLGSFSRVAARHHLANKWFLLAAAALALVVIAAISWSWLVAAGIASILLSALPCLVMCGLGLCMHKFMGGAGASQALGSATANPEAPAIAPAAASAIPVLGCCQGAISEKPAGVLAPDSREETHA